MSLSWDDLLGGDDENNNTNNNSLLSSKYLPIAEELICSFDEIRHIPQKELYRLIVDGQFHQEENGWFGYAKREPNSLSACFHALEIAFKNINDTHLSIELIKSIHQSATFHVERLNAHTKPGEFRVNQGGYFLIQGAHPFLSKNGFFQLVKKVNEETIHYGACITVLTKQEAAGLNSPTFYEQVANMKNTEMIPEKLWEEISDFFQNNIVFYRAPDVCYLPFLLQKICDQYNSDIKLAINFEDKLQIIAKTAQAVEQLHVFPDANGRTSLILLQRLLVQNEFYPVMLYNPNYIDGYELSELVNELKNGSYNTKLIIQNPTQIIYNYQTQVFNQPSQNKIINDYYYAENQLHEQLQSIFSSKLNCK